MSLISKNLFIILIIAIISIILSSGCIQETTDEDVTPTIKVTETPLLEENVTSQVEETVLPQVNISVPAWMSIELTDVATGDTFKISDFIGKPILMETFAVWCPTCLKQQQQIQELRSEETDVIVHISLDTDPNEDAAKVQGHLDNHGFDWYFAVSPIELSNALIDEFGLLVVSAPQAPVILICEDGSSRLLQRGVKSSQILRAEVDKGC